MRRVARTVVPGVPHHVTRRGNNRHDVFFVDDDRRAYLAMLKQRSEVYSLKIVGYCLMTNHVHLIAVPATEDALPKAVGRTHYRYTQYVNRIHGRSGHLWQNRFCSCPMDAVHLWRSLSYVERNPVRARIVRVPWRYRWSSAAAHCGANDPSDLLHLLSWRRRWPVHWWKRELHRREDAALVGQMGRCLRSGRPLASDRFISKLEASVGERLRLLPIGRPREKGRKSSEREGRRQNKR